MQIRQRQLLYGTLFGFSTFLAGWLITYYFTPSELFTDFPRWKVSLWVFLSAHFVSISGHQVGGLSSTLTEVDVIAEVPALRSLRIVPILLTALGGMITIEAINYTARLRYLLQNSAALLIGYLAAGLIAFVISEAQPGAAILIILAVFLATVTYIGGTITQRLTSNVPVFAVTSVGGVVLIGLLVVLGGVVILQSIAPLIAISALGVTFGALLKWIARNTP